MAPRSTTSEYRSYPWIKAGLLSSGWNSHNPNTDPRGQVWEQNEALSNPEIKAGLGTQRPEFVVRVTDNQYWTVEAKGSHPQLARAIAEAKGYAEAINGASTVVRVRFATGVAGTDTVGYKVRTLFLTGSGDWVPVVHGGANFEGFITNQEALRILSAENPDLNAVPMTVAEVVEIAKYINTKLHSAKVPKERRALLIAILLLALEQDPGLGMTGQPSVFIADINSRAKRVFENAGRVPLWESLQILPGGDNIASQAAALSDVLQKLKSNDILNTARSTDILGAFFESFLRYGNTSKDLGIVLTPRHLCWLAVEALGITKHDVVYDPTVGTAGFLVAAFNRVLESATPVESKRFAIANLYGVEHADNVAALAFINMYFRGDGKHNLKIGSSLPYRLVAETGKDALQFKTGLPLASGESLAVTQVLMNPPFALPDEDEAEVHFVEHGLRQLVQNGLLFTVLPSSVMYEADYAEWRRELLGHNTLLSVIALPTDVFYPVATESIGVFLRKGRPHATGENVLWIRLTDDGFVKRKGFRVERRGVHFREFLRPTADILRRWLISGIETAAIRGQIEFSPLANPEWLPQVHLGTADLAPTEFDRQVRETYRQSLAQRLRAPKILEDQEEGGVEIDV